MNCNYDYNDSYFGIDNFNYELEELGHGWSVEEGVDGGKACDDETNRYQQEKEMAGGEAIIKREVVEGKKGDRDERSVEEKGDKGSMGVRKRKKDEEATTDKGTEKTKRRKQIYKKSCSKNIRFYNYPKGGTATDLRNAKSIILTYCNMNEVKKDDFIKILNIEKEDLEVALKEKKHKSIKEFKVNWDIDRKKFAEKLVKLYSGCGRNTFDGLLSELNNPETDNIYQVVEKVKKKEKCESKYRYWSLTNNGCKNDGRHKKNIQTAANHIKAYCIQKNIPINEFIETLKSIRTKWEENGGEITPKVQCKFSVRTEPAILAKSLMQVYSLNGRFTLDELIEKIKKDDHGEGKQEEGADVY